VSAPSLALAPARGIPEHRTVPDSGMSASLLAAGSSASGLALPDGGQGSPMHSSGSWRRGEREHAASGTRALVARTATAAVWESAAGQRDVGGQRGSHRRVGASGVAVLFRSAGGAFRRV